MKILDYYSGEIKAQLNIGEKLLVKDVKFCLEEGQTLAFIGETGSGKTIIAQSLMKLLPSNVVAKGTNIEFCGEDISAEKKLSKLLGRQIVYIPQSGHECLNPSIKIKSHMAESLKINGVARRDILKAAREKLRAAGFDDPDDILNKYSFELSGGMAQKVVVALATCANPRLVIADEPTNGIDGRAKHEIIKLIGALFPSAGKILITHDITVAEQSDFVLVLCKGRVMERGQTSTVLNNPKHPYTKALINSCVKNGLQGTPKLREIAGDCPFYARCALACDKCLKCENFAQADGDKVRCVLC